MSSVFLNSSGNSNSSTSPSSSQLRIPGMASGLDTDSIVKSMVSSYQTKIDKANQDEQIVQWKQAAYRDIIKGIKGLQDYFDPLSSKYIMGSKSFDINSATSDTASVASATAGSSAKAGTYSVNVTQLATQAIIQGTANNSIISTSNFASATSQKLTDSKGNLLVDLSGVSGTGADLVAQINSKIASSALNGKVSATYAGGADGNGGIIFTNLASNSTSVNYSDSKITAGVTINSGISSASKLTSSGLGILSNNTIISAKNLVAVNTPKLTDSNGNTLVDLSGVSGTGADLATQINTKIASSSLNGKVTAQYVKDASGNDAIEFTNLTTTPVTYSDSASGSTTFNGGNLSFALSDGSNTYNVSLSVDGNTTMKNLIDAVNSATNGAISMNIDDTTGAISFQSKNSGSSSSISIVDKSTGSNSLSKLGITSNSYTGTTNVATDGSTLLSSLGFAAGSMSFTVNNKTVSLTVGAATKMSDLITAFNNSGSGATMSIDNTGKVLISSVTNITNTTTGTNNNIISLLGLNNGKGKDAIVSITAPGQSTAMTTTESSNNFTVNGVSYNLVSKGIANVTVTGNADNVVTNIKNFITDYNTIISTINTKLTEKKDSDYQPLTDAQKSSMSDSQITAWEAKAKVGVLHNDDNLEQLMTQLRSVFSAPVYSNYNSSDTSTGKLSLSFGQYGSNSIGIDTSTDVTSGGQLVITDETKLRNAISNNFDDFKKIFIGASSASLGTNQSYAGSEKYNEDGLFKRIDTVLRDYVADPGIGKDGTYTLSGSMNIFVNKQYDYSTTGSGGKNTLPDQVYSKTVSISKLKTQMSDAETRYYNQFTQLETALSQLNSQQSSLSSMLGTA